MNIIHQDAVTQIILSTIDEHFDVDLPYIITEKIDKFIREEDKTRSRNAWSIVVSRYREKFGKDPIIKYNPYHKPLIDDFYFNISHHERYIVVALSHSNIGVDISGITDRKINLDSFRNCFGPTEHIEDENTFHKYWSAKEAFVKYIGKGLSIPLDSVSISFHPGLDEVQKVMVRYENTTTIGTCIEYEDNWITFFIKSD